MSATTFSHCAPSTSLRFGVPHFLAIWVQRVRQRAQDRDALQYMSDRDLMDINASRYEVVREIAKPFWRG
ncbi:MAG: hypothetical protein WCI94_00370 [Rhodospirillales bacterium]